MILKRIFEILDTCKHGDRKLRARFLKFVIAFSLFLDKSEGFLRKVAICNVQKNDQFLFEVKLSYTFFYIFC